MFGIWTKPKNEVDVWEYLNRRITWLEDQWLREKKNTRDVSLRVMKMEFGGELTDEQFMEWNRKQYEELMHD